MQGLRIKIVCASITLMKAVPFMKKVKTIVQQKKDFNLWSLSLEMEYRKPHGEGVISKVTDEGIKRLSHLSLRALGRF